MNGPIDAGTISLRSALLMAASAISVGILWQSVKGDMVGQDKRIDALERDAGKIDKLAMVICLDTPERVERCKHLGLLQ